MGMCGFGLALEAMITVLGPRFVPFFLFILVRTLDYVRAPSLSMLL